LAALLRNARIIIFDEPTAVLNQTESEKIFALVKRLAAAGITVVIISHKLDETLALAQRASVFRKGIRAAVLDKHEFDVQKIIRLMFGQDSAAASVTTAAGGAPDIGGTEMSAESTEKQDCAAKDIVLAAEKLSMERSGYPALRALNMELSGGVIYGLAGVRESGTEALLLTLSGFLKPSAGRIMVGGKLIFNGKGKNDGDKTASAENSALGFRKAGGVYLGMNSGPAITAYDKELSIHDNMVIHAHRRFPHPNRLLAGMGLLDSGRLREWTRDLMLKAGISGPPSAKAGSLSGGMLQRLLTARELSENAVVILMSEPGWGLDVQRRRELYLILENESKAGKAVMLFLSDLNDLLEVSGEIFVMTNGGISLNLKSGDMRRMGTAAAKAKINAAMCGAAV
jgi:simple sugar transport system ATP-binding protein